LSPPKNRTSQEAYYDLKKTRPIEIGKHVSRQSADSELQRLRTDLRATVRAYAARLETNFAESRAALTSFKPAEELSRERLKQVRDLMIHVRKRTLKPEKGRRRDLRKIDSLIEDLQLLVPNKLQR
jgi:hypothetical protein